MKANLASWCVLSLVTSCSVLAEDWSQFRGPNASGVATGSARLPAEIGPEKNLLWKVPLAKGHSSPVVHDGRVYLTALQDKRLVTIALDADTGEQLWQAVAPHKKLESVHKIGSPATASVATDGEFVISLFGSCGLFCYDTDGNRIWHRPMGPFNNQFGAPSSPLIVGDKVILSEDHDTGSFLAAFDKRTGRPLWRTDRDNFRRNYGTPVIWTVNRRQQIVVAGTVHIVGYDLETGRQIWSVQGLCRVVSNTPVIGDDNVLYVASTGGGSTPPQPSFRELVASSDANGNGVLESSELPNSSIKGFFGQFDRDQNGELNEREYESIREIFEVSQSVAMAIRPGGSGDVTDTHVRWIYPKSVPRNSSPVYFDEHLYMIKDGGILTCLDANTGRVTKQGRLADAGKYFSSPVVGDGKIYALSETGTLSVVSAGPKWQLIAQADFGEDVYASPAIADGRIYIRTTQRLYCFGSPK